MITLKIKKWVPINNIDHIQTSWEVWGDAAMTMKLDSLYNSSEFLDIYYSDITPPVNAVYYIRAKRFFNNKTDSGWSDLVPVRGSVEDNASTLLINTDVIIDTPMVYIDEAIIKDKTKPTFTITTSTFKSTLEGHSLTDWVIYNGVGEVVFASLANTTDLTSITINKADINLSNLAMLKIIAIHGTGSGMTSKAGIRNIILSNNLFNYEITNTDNNRVYPYNDYIINFKKVNQYKDYGVIKLEVFDTFTKDPIYSKNILPTASRVLIPGELLADDSTYTVILLSMVGDGSYLTNEITLNTVTINEFDIIDKNYTYANKTEFIYDTGANLIPSFMVTNEIYTKQIPMVNNKQFVLANYDRSTKRLNVVKTLSNVTLYKNQDNMWIKLLSNNLLVINTVNNNGNVVFDIYDFDSYTNTVQFKQTITLTDETTPLGKTNGIVMTGIDEAIYLPVGGSKLKSVNFSTKTVTTVTTIPLTGLGNATLIDQHDGRVTVMGGTSAISKDYNIKEKIWLDGVRIPKPFRNSDLQKIDLVNTNSVIFKTNYKDSNNFMIYNPINGTLDDITNPNVNNTEPTTCIKLKTGDILRVSIDPNTKTEFISKFY